MIGTSMLFADVRDLARRVSGLGPVSNVGVGRGMSLAICLHELNESLPAAVVQTIARRSTGFGRFRKGR
jgi:hypothetical protein